MIVLNIKNWNENRVVQLEENWTLEWKQGYFEPRNLGMKTFPHFEALKIWLEIQFLFLRPNKPGKKLPENRKKEVFVSVIIGAWHAIVKSNQWLFP